MVAGPRWRVFAISNVGGELGAITSAGADPLDLLTHPDGRAGQWVIDYFRPPPTPTTGPDGQAGLDYPLSRITVRPTGARMGSPVGNVSVTLQRPLRHLQQRFIRSYASALRAATDEERSPRRWSVSTFCPGSGQCLWVFDAVNEEGTTSQRFEVTANGRVRSVDPAS